MKLDPERSFMEGARFRKWPLFLLKSKTDFNQTHASSHYCDLEWNTLFVELFQCFDD